MDTLIKDALILTQNKRREQVRGSILIENGVIKEVGKARGSAEKIIDGSGCIAVPAFINTFSTAGKGLKNEMRRNGIRMAGVGWTVLPSLTKCTKDVLKQAAGKKIMVPVGRTRGEVFEVMKKTKKKPVEYLDSLGLLGENTIILGGSWVTAREIKLIAKRGATVCGCPVADLENGTGAICPISEYIGAGANLVLATGDSSSLSMFEVVRLAVLMQNHFYWRKGAVDCQDVLDAVTVNAARALGLDCGITAGAPADILLLRRRTVFKDPLESVVLGSGPQYIKNILISGKGID